MERKLEWVSSARFAPYLAAAEGLEDLAWQLYEWNAHMASALWECFHHLEVLLRNAMMRSLEKVHPLAYPWHSELPAVVAAAGKHTSKSASAQPDDIIAELTLGFWTSLLKPSPANDELWRRHLRHAFPHSPGTRQAVDIVLQDLRQLRNRCAHQDSLLMVNPGVELKKILSVAEWIDPASRAWLEAIQSVTATAGERPVPQRRNTLVVPVQEGAIATYAKVGAYVCPADRSFAEVDYLGFYHDKQIDPWFPRVTQITIPARWNREEAHRLQASDLQADQDLGRVMGYCLNHGQEPGSYVQVFLLSPKNQPETRTRPDSAPLRHLGTGRGSAFVHRHRYFHIEEVLWASTTADLTPDPE